MRKWRTDLHWKLVAVDWDRVLLIFVLALVPLGIWALRDIPRWQVGEFVTHNPGVNAADRFRLEDESRNLADIL
ncbi:MAG: hypothetical protein ABSF98_08655 [Bryobacteraceae bacterium]|jgi:hypothetical protein